MAVNQRVHSGFNPYVPQGHQIRKRQQDDGAERGHRVRAHPAAAGGGVGQHRHAHGVPEPDCGVRPQRI